MPSRHPLFESWKATCAINPQMADEFHEKAKKIASKELNQLCGLLRVNQKTELANQIMEYKDDIILASTPANKVTNIKEWSESRQKAEKLCLLLSDKVDELGPLTYQRPGLGDSLFHFMGEFSAREKLGVDMDETYRQFAKKKNEYIDDMKAKGLSTDLKKTDEEFSISSRYANKVFMQNVQVLKEGYDDKGLFGKRGSSKKHEEFVNSVIELSEASAHIVNASFGDERALKRKVKAMTRAKQAALDYVAAKKDEAGIDPDNTEWRPKTPMGRKRFESALSLIIGIDDEFERLNAPETPDPIYDGELPEEELNIDQPFLKYTWVCRLSDIPKEEPNDENAREAFIKEYKRCKLAIDIIEKTKDLPPNEKTPERFMEMLNTAMNDKGKQAELDAKLGDDPWENLSRDKSEVAMHYFTVEIMEQLAPVQTASPHLRYGEDAKKLGDISKNLKDKGLFGKRGSSNEHGALVTAADDLQKLTEARSKSAEDSEKLREEHIKALQKAKKAAEDYIAEKKKHGWGDTSSPDWRPLSPMGKLRYEAALNLLNYADEQLESEMYLEEEKSQDSPETENEIGTEDAVSERSDSMSDLDGFENDATELSENELNDRETTTLDNNVKDIEGRDEMIEEVGETLEERVEPEQEKAPEKDDSKIPADLNKEKYLGWLEEAGALLNSPNANWNDAKLEIMASTASVLFINQLENAYTKQGKPMPNISQQTFNECVADKMRDPAFDRTLEQFGGTSFGALNRVQVSVLKDGGKDFFAKFRKNQMTIENENKMNEKIKEDFQKKNELTKNKNKKLEHIMK